MPYSDVLEQWPLIIADFSTVYGIRLVLEYPGMLWHEFIMLLAGVFADPDSRLSKHFAPEPVTETESWPDQL